MACKRKALGCGEEFIIKVSAGVLLGTSRSLVTQRLLSRTVVANLFGTGDRFPGRQFFHRPGWWRGGGRVG